MLNKFLLPFLCFFLSISALAANGEIAAFGPSELPKADPQYGMQDNFNEFSPLFEQFLQQNRQLIATGQFRQARESLSPFLDQFRMRLGFRTGSYLEFALKNHSAEDTARVQQQMIGKFIYELSLNNVSGDVRTKLENAIISSTGAQFLESLFKYKRTLLLFLYAVLGENEMLQNQDRAAVAQSIMSDFNFLISPALRFYTADPNYFLIVFESELSITRDQMSFESDLADFVQRHLAYFPFLRPQNNQNAVAYEFRRYKSYQHDIVRKSLMLRNPGAPLQAAPPSLDLPIAAPQMSEAEARSATAIISSATTQSAGTLQFDAGALSEISFSDGSLENLVQQIKDYLTSSMMVWGQKQIQFYSSFTHSTSQIRVTVKDFSLNEKFLLASAAYYLADLNTFFNLAKGALERQNTLSNRDMIYNCLVKQSLGPSMVNCDDVLRTTSRYDDTVRKSLSDAYTRLLRYSRLTFEHSTSLSISPDMQTICERIKTLQGEMLQSYRSTTNSYLPSLLNIQGPSFKDLSTGQRQHLCGGSLNPLLQ